jgi:hypothetical protein
MSTIPRVRLHRVRAFPVSLEALRVSKLQGTSYPQGMVAVSHTTGAGPSYIIEEHSALAAIDGVSGTATWAKLPLAGRPDLLPVQAGVTASPDGAVLADPVVADSVLSPKLAP